MRLSWLRKKGRVGVVPNPEGLDLREWYAGEEVREREKGACEVCKGESCRRPVRAKRRNCSRDRLQRSWRYLASSGRSCITETSRMRPTSAVNACRAYCVELSLDL